MNWPLTRPYAASVCADGSRYTPLTTTLDSTTEYPPVSFILSPRCTLMSSSGPKSFTNLPDKSIDGAFHGDSVQNILNGLPLVAPDAMYVRSVTLPSSPIHLKTRLPPAWTYTRLPTLSKMNFACSVSFVQYSAYVAFQSTSAGGAMTSPSHTSGFMRSTEKPDSLAASM